MAAIGTAFFATGTAKVFAVPLNKVLVTGQAIFRMANFVVTHTTLAADLTTITTVFAGTSASADAVDGETRALVELVFCAAADVDQNKIDSPTIRTYLYGVSIGNR